MLVEFTLINGNLLAVNPDQIASFFETADVVDGRLMSFVKLKLVGGSVHFVKGSYDSVRSFIGVEPQNAF